jgi:hypothetical protein
MLLSSSLRKCTHEGPWTLMPCPCCWQRSGGGLDWDMSILSWRPGSTYPQQVLTELKIRCESIPSKHEASNNSGSKYFLTRSVQNLEQWALLLLKSVVKSCSFCIHFTISGLHISELLL